MDKEKFLKFDLIYSICQFIGCVIFFLIGLNGRRDLASWGTIGLLVLGVIIDLIGRKFITDEENEK